MNILIDAGHGGSDPGTIGFGRTEADLNLADAHMLKACILYHRPKANVVITRDSNKTLDRITRKAIILSRKWDMFCCIHHNAGGGHGFESYISRDPSYADRWIQGEIHRRLQPHFLEYRIKDRGPKQLNFWVLVSNTVPEIFLEMGFMDSSYDMSWMVSSGVKQQLLRTIAEVLINACEHKTMGKT